ncbi:acyl-CoA thioesterase FadM [Micromonospora echinospora]|uniref:Acyl-CoA thioesterase FadM n=1 Tax=Micromonospora echinospora TaxID=1877 RepID=A0ABR6MBI5_MICEC|nr:acyl-ACP thioesterase domain-containing protein [Micromonospora echinospora]MBB5112734.1 acyl-CoA thioesterase FadM [Micromonospora echinospora]
MAPLTTALHLRWADTDHYGHVNNVTWLRFVDEARTTTYLLAQTTLVVCDLADRRPRPLTAAERDALAPYRGDPLTFR